MAVDGALRDEKARPDLLVAQAVRDEARDVELVACVDSEARALALLQDQTRIAKKRCFASLDAALNAFQADAVLNTRTLRQVVNSVD